MVYKNILKCNNHCIPRNFHCLQEMLLETLYVICVAGKVTQLCYVDTP